MKKYFLLFLILLSYFTSQAQTAPVSPVQMNQATPYREPSVRNRLWFYNGALNRFWLVPDSITVKNWVGGSQDSIAFTNKFKNIGTVHSAIIDLNLDTIGNGGFVTWTAGHGLKRDTNHYLPLYLPTNTTIHQNGFILTLNGRIVTGSTITAGSTVTAPLLTINKGDIRTSEVTGVWFHNLSTANDSITRQNSTDAKFTGSAYDITTSSPHELDWKIGLRAIDGNPVNSKLVFRSRIDTTSSYHTNFELYDDGRVVLPSLPDTTAGYKALVIRADGTVQTAPYGSGGSDSTIYKTDGSLTGDRTVNVGSHKITFSGAQVGQAANFYIDDTSGGSGIVAITTDPTTQAAITIGSGGGDSNLSFSVQNGSHVSKSITMDSGTGTNGLLVMDQIDNVGMVANSSIDTAKISLKPKAYVTNEWVMGHLAGISTGVASVTGTTNRITSTGGTTPVIDISASYVGQSSITTVGTLSAGSIPYSLLTGTPTIMTSANFVYNETPSGTINGSNVTFTLANTPVSGKVSLYKNGLKLSPSEYSITGATITYTVAPNTSPFTDILLADYIK
jgi:hypothetical protein